MTPEEAVNELFAKGQSHRGELLQLFEAVAATAKEKETRRCVARVKMWSVRLPGLSIARQRSIAAELVNELLISGGLEVEK